MLDPKRGGGWVLRWLDSANTHTHPLKSVTLSDALDEVDAIVQRGRQRPGGVHLVTMTPEQLEALYELLAGQPADTPLGGLRKHLRRVRKEAKQ